MFRIRREHIIGLAVGALVGAAVAALGPAVGFNVTLQDGILWGAVVGSILAAFPQFAQSGAVLTRGENETLNVVVGLAGSLLFLLAVAALAGLISSLLF